MYNRKHTPWHDDDDYPYLTTPVRRRRTCRIVFNEDMIAPCIIAGVLIIVSIMTVIIAGREIVEVMAGIRDQLIDMKQAWHENF